VITRVRGTRYGLPLRGRWRYEDQTCGRCGGWAEAVVDGERLCYSCVDLADGPTLPCELCDRPGAVAVVNVGAFGVCAGCAVDLRADPDRMVVP